jgi:predicted nucleic acid binding AN1-type Zn finger protein
MFNDAIRSIIDLLRIKKDVKKTDLEIDKLSREKNQSEALVKVASEEDIKKYDPKVERLEKKLAEKAPRQLIKNRPVIIALIIIAIVLMIAEGFILYKIIF